MSLTTHRSRPFSSSQRLPEPEQPPVLHEPEEAGALLAEFIHRYPRLLILTGAGVSTDSGIPDYRDGDGAGSASSRFSTRRSWKTSTRASATGAAA